MHTLEDIARLTGLTLAGDGSVRVARPASPAKAGPDDLALAMNKDYAEALAASPARAAVVWDGADWQALGLDAALIAPRARVALAHVTRSFQPPLDIEPGIHPTAVLDPSAEIGPDATIGPFAVIGPRARIGPRAVIAAHASIGADAAIGADALLHQGVRFGARCIAGDRLTIHQNAVIGADGFSFEPPERGNVEAAKETGETASATRTTGFLRIHSLAAVELGDEVEIGALTSIDRGTIEPTRVGSGTKIDNQVQLGHNVQVGRTCLICAQVGLAGSVRVGDRVVLGGKVGVGDHIEIGSDVVCAGGTLVASRIRPGSVMMGIPATSREQATREIMAMRRLPRLVEQVAEIRKKLGL